MLVSYLDENRSSLRREPEMDAGQASVSPVARASVITDGGLDRVGHELRYHQFNCVGQFVEVPLAGQATGMQTSAWRGSRERSHGQHALKCPTGSWYGRLLTRYEHLGLCEQRDERLQNLAGMHVFTQWRDPRAFTPWTLIGQADGYA
jgi:hypothetical protein